MSMFNCPECGTKISDKAKICPYCGFNLAETEKYQVLPKLDFKLYSQNNDNFVDIALSKQLNDEILNIFANAENLAKMAPSFFDSVMSLFPKTIKVADINPRIQELLDKGIYRFVQDEKTGQNLAVLFKDGKVAEWIRFKDIKITPNLASSLAMFTIQLSITQIVEEVNKLNKNIELVRKEMYNDRLARNDSVLQQFKQVEQINDTRLRNQMFVNIISAATNSRCELIKTFKERLNTINENNGVFGDQNKINTASYEIFECLDKIIQTVFVSTQAYSLMGEQDSAIVVLNQFKDFLHQNKLDDKNTLLSINSETNINNKEYEKFINKFDKLQNNIQKMIKKIPDEKFLLSKFNGGEND